MEDNWTFRTTEIDGYVYFYTEFKPQLLSTWSWLPQERMEAGGKSRPLNITPELRAQLKSAAKETFLPSDNATIVTPPFNYLEYLDRLRAKADSTKSDL